MLDGLSLINERIASYLVTFVRGVEAQELLRLFGGDLAHAWLVPCLDPKVTNLEAYQEYLDTRPELDEERFQGNYDVWSRPWIQVGQCGEWAFALEREITSRGTEQEFLRNVSAGTAVVSISFNLNIDLFSYAENGVVLAQFSPLTPHEPWVGDPARVRGLFRQAGVDFESEDYFYTAEVMFALVEGAGVRLDREAVAKPLLTGEILLRSEEEGIS